MRLKHKVSVIVPSKIGENEVNNSKYVHEVMKRLSNEFGGASSIEQKGAWVSDEDGLVIENNELVYAYCNDIEEGEKIAKELGLYIKVEMKQEGS